jgi:hypothetical protein
MPAKNLMYLVYEKQGEVTKVSHATRSVQAKVVADGKGVGPEIASGHFAGVEPS